MCQKIVNTEKHGIIKKKSPVTDMYLFLREPSQHKYVFLCFP